MKMKNVIDNAEETEQNKADDPYEKCVICGADTPYRFSTPITQRKYYVKGSGQICQHCDYKIYTKKSD
jgi:DNA-directed RNA polymerase subunit RPC12/RpoP